MISKYYLQICFSIILAIFLSACGGSKEISSANIAKQPHALRIDNIRSISTPSQKLSATLAATANKNSITITYKHSNISSQRHYQFFINIDNNSNTGYQFDNEVWNQSGTDYLIEDDILFKSNSNDNYWGWDEVDAEVAFKTTESSVSITIQKSLLTGLASQLQIGFLERGHDWGTVDFFPKSSQMALFSIAVNPTGTSSKWLGNARIAGAELFFDMTNAEIKTVLDQMQAQSVNVIEADSDLSNYLDDARFQDEVNFIKRFTQLAHDRNMRVVWYSPALETITPNGKNIANTMFKDHPDWVQIGLNGEPNVFYGGSGRVHWVSKNAESAWLSPSSPYAEYFLARVKKIAATGVDGLWLDVPLYNDIGVQWADLNPYAVKRFKADTGLTSPSNINWDDPVWRRWIQWRYSEISRFLRRIDTAATSVNPDFSIITENVTLDYNATTILGLDGAKLKQDKNILQVWEVDVVSDSNSMINAQWDDWIALIGMNKFAVGASGQKPSWIFSYGRYEDDAELVMATALATGNHPYETRIPNMTTTVGSEYRTRMFSWQKTHNDKLFKSQSKAPIAIYLSPESRDYVDGKHGLGSGLYATTQSNDSLWWSHEREDSVYSRNYLADYRGVIKTLVEQHIPFDIIVYPDANELSRYDTVIAPTLTAISDSQASLLNNYAFAGGHLIITGDNPSGKDELGTERANYALSKALNYNKSATMSLPTDAWRSHYGAGEVVWFATQPARSYLIEKNSASATALVNEIKRLTPTRLQTSAPKQVHLELRKHNNSVLLHAVNATGIDGSLSIEPVSFTVDVALVAGQKPKKVILHSPDLTSSVDLNFSIVENAVQFTLPLQAYAMVEIVM